MLPIYEDYLKHKEEGTDGRKLWSQVPKSVINTTICATIGENTIDDIFKNVDELKGKRKVDIIIGGPPCQAYSVAGRARMGKEVEKDPRNELYKYYVQFIEHYDPEMFVFENVLGLLTAKRGEPFADLKRLVDKLGYDMDCKVQIASQHGVLQNRQRVIIVGWKRAVKGLKSPYHYPGTTSGGVSISSSKGSVLGFASTKSGRRKILRNRIVCQTSVRDAISQSVRDTRRVGFYNSTCSQTDQRKRS